jgi:hypothetical protein
MLTGRLDGCLSSCRLIRRPDTPPTSRRRPNTEVHLIEGTGHVAMSKAPEVVPMIIGWLRTQFTDNYARSS